MARVEVLKRRILRKKTRSGSPLVAEAPAAAPKQGTKAPPFDFRPGGKK